MAHNMFLDLPKNNEAWDPYQIQKNILDPNKKIVNPPGILEAIIIHTDHGCTIAHIKTNQNKYIELDLLALLDFGEYLSRNLAFHTTKNAQDCEILKMAYSKYYESTNAGFKELPQETQNWFKDYVTKIQ